MHACPVPAAALLCPVVLLLALLPSPATTAAALNTSNPCAPALCGGINIAFPFWLAGKHPPECGYKAYQVTCDKGNLTLKNSYWTYQLLDIFYQNSSFRADLSGGLCDFKNFVNAASDLGLSPFKISPKNQELFFLYDCELRGRHAPRSWTLVNCSSPDDPPWAFALLGKNYTPGGTGMPPPMNCNVSTTPVLGYEGATGADYQRLLKGGSLLEYTDDEPCKDCTDTGGRCRVNVSDDAFACYCNDGDDGWFICGSKRIGTKIIIMIVWMTVAASLLLPCIYVLVWHRKRGKLHFFLCEKTSRSTQRNIEALIVLHGSLAPKRYKYSEVTKITSSFSNKLGEGGYGAVFKGRLDDGRQVAVKFLHDSKGEGEEFVNEVMSIGRTSHVNIVNLFGFCLEGSKRAIIYEYMPNGSLDKFIYSENPKAVLGWDKLYTIAIGIARGLEYLHHSCNTRIIHFDIKPQNILLDEDFHPKVADFGLAKLCHTKESKLSMAGARGTVGFIAPEVHSRTFGVVSTKSDVYSYGMMLLEMVGGRKNVNSIAQKSSEKYFPHWIYDHFGRGDGLQACDVSSENEGIAKKMSVIGLWCIQILPMHRPTITKVLEMFERALDELDMPPRQNFSQILEDPNYNLNAQSLSTSSGTKTQVFSEVLKMKEMSLENSKLLQRLPTL
ncbi:hypothetical protein SETIT_5G094800v2 [Setaria italica]|uniref:Protein kinase domain-containing protein n=1 Tax=Setaria italica TaxID=4555 RepID=A0A368R2Y7_SETIT|nr:LEAF RUST 10 DISEASE-RESISTANCE LOCUS RECEPTOR-LIKE PROTEIN KINASE-like 2.5 isoform X1 [Setaria italica]RCV24557.1 hypothetical protein SETIT_5G094800v2 [Setaria italica]